MIYLYHSLHGANNRNVIVCADVASRLERDDQAAKDIFRRFEITSPLCFNVKRMKIVGAVKYRRPELTGGRWKNLNFAEQIRGVKKETSRIAKELL